MDLGHALALHQSGRRAEAEAAYRALIARDPNLAPALHGLGVLLLQAGESTRAVELLRRACALDPGAPGYAANLGLALFREGDLKGAAAALTEAARLKPGWAQPHYDLGVVLSADRQGEAAMRAYRAALRIEPNHLRAEVNLANLLKAQGKRAQAIAGYRRALRIAPNESQVHNNLGVALREEGDTAAAEACFRAALRIQPRFAEALGNLASLLIEARHFTEGVIIAASAVEAAPEWPGFAEMHADALRGAARYDEAMAEYERALRLSPGRVSARFGMAEALHLKRDHEAAEAMLRQLVSEFPDRWQAHHDLGNALRDQGKFTEAEAAYRRALALAETPEVLNQLGAVLRDLNRLDEATAFLKRAVAAAPKSLDAQYNLSVTHLTAGRLAEGLALYESRFAKFRPRPLLGQAWTGGPVRGLTLLVAAEQGMGDTIQFLRYLPALKEEGARIILRIQPALKRLLCGVAGADSVMAWDDAPVPYDAYVSIMSLPHLLRIADPLPGAVPYLRADLEGVEAWRQRLGHLNGRRVGLVWAGNPGFTADHLRSIPAALLAPLGAVSGVCFLSLQKDATALPPFPIEDVSSHLTDMADTAALLEALDLVITVDTAVAHLGGAMGRPVWVLNRFDTCWRWLTCRDDSVWYPSLRLFRQREPGNWESAVTSASVALAEFRP